MTFDMSLPTAAELGVPTWWTPGRVGERLIDAFRIDARMPRIKRPKQLGFSHPTIEYSDEDRAEWLMEDIDETRFAPVVEEVEAMETIFGWLMWLGPRLRDSAKIWCRDRAAGKSLRSSAKRSGLHVDTLKARADSAFSLIAQRLNEENVPLA